MRFLKTNTATRITVGPFLDKTDGITPEVALTATNEHLTLMVDDGGVPTLALDANATASAGSNDLVHVTNDDAGFYDLELTATQLNYVGRAMLSINYVTDHCPVFHEFMILPAVVYDSLVGGTDNLQVDTIQVGGTTQTARDLGASVLLSSGTGTGQISLTSGTVTVGTNNDKTGYTASTVSDKTGYSLADATSDAVIADAVWNAATATYGTADTYGALVESGNVGGGAIVAASVTAGVTVTTNNDKTGYTASTVSDKTGYSLSSPQTFSLTGDITGNLSGSVGSVTGAVGSVTGNVTGSVGSLATQAKADVNAEIVDALTVDTYAEPAAVIAATSSLKDKLCWLFTLGRNKITQTSTTSTLRNDADGADIATSTVSDNGTTATRGEWT